ncbi:MAG TPA: outer membrane protein assembly factor BamE [Verrucomicrobiae bacterium]|nr:outer membrane protein assembly factor BamE [Verrucomicrobiae bacterium]
MRIAAVLALALSLCACGLVFKLPTRQGNVLDQKDLDALELGMSRDQVKFLLGTPIAASVFRNDRWDYVGYYKNPRGKVFSRTVSLFFQGDSLVNIEGQKAVAGDSTPDLEAIAKEEKKAATEAERSKEPADSGIVIQQPKK